MREERNHMTDNIETPEVISKRDKGFTLVERLIVIVILGMIMGEFVRSLILASAGGVAGVPTVAKIAKGAVILIAIFMALQQVGVAEEIVTAAFTLILGAVALAVGLAFGLGNRDLAGEITRRWYEEGQRRDRRRTDRQGPNTPPPGEPPMLD